MPVKSNLNSQGLAWFHTQAGRCLLESERTAMEQFLDAQPCAPWLWLGIQGVQSPSAPYGVRLHRRLTNLNSDRSESDPKLAENSPVAQIPGFGGAVQCELPLPFASESFGTIFIQHVLDDGRDWHFLLSECERLLMPGGVLWVACINPFSPYRLRSVRRAVHAQSSHRWRRDLNAIGFDPAVTSLQWLGPQWKCTARPLHIGPLDFFRAVTVVSARKMRTARIGGSRVGAAWRPRLVGAGVNASHGAARTEKKESTRAPSLRIVSTDETGHGKL